MCRRPEPITANEGRQLGWDRYAAICCIREQLACGTLDAPTGDYEYLSDFSEDAPILRPSSAKSASILSPTISTSRSSLADETEPVSQDEPNSSGDLRAKREQDAPTNAGKCKDSALEVATGRDSIIVPLHTLNHREYKGTQEEHRSNGGEVPQVSLQRRDQDRVATANKLYLLGDEHQFQRQHEQALKAFNNALQLYRELDHRPRIARCLRMIGECKSRMILLPNEARAAYIDASKVYRELGDRRDAAQCLHIVGQSLWRQGLYSEAGTAYYEMLELYRELDVPLEVAKCLHMIGEVERIQGDYEAGVSAYTEAYELFLGLDDLLGVAKNLSMIGACKRLVPGLSSETLAAYREASQYYQKLGHQKDEGRCIQMVGECHREEGRYEEAQDAYRAASVIYGKSGHQLGVGHCLSMIEECQRAQDHSLT
ncbi:hypothetical protein FRB94_001606 [Tulasnella sp. JGI-2019a]|nr:hypothetical protein FRB94_001606 [Tulasnella sp. JGI-2019a]